MVVVGPYNVSFAGFSVELTEPYLAMHVIVAFSFLFFRFKESQATLERGVCVSFRGVHLLVDSYSHMFCLFILAESLNS